MRKSLEQEWAEREAARKTVEKVKEETPPVDLFDTYGIKSSLPRKTKVEMLMLLYRIDAPEIATILGVPEKTIQQDIDFLEAQWKKLGQPLSGEDRELARGQMIAELMQIKIALDQLLVDNNDPKLLQQSMNVLDRIAKLRGLETDRRDTVETVSDDSFSLDQLIREMDTSVLEELHAKLRD